jgi:uncharacterized membrane protein
MLPDNSSFSNHFTQHPDNTLFSALIRPHCCLTHTHILWIVGGVTSAFAILSIPLLILGAWPVLGFMGLDVIALYIAFRVSVYRAQAYEEVALSPAVLHVRKVAPNGTSRDWTLNPRWLKIVRQVDEDYGVLDLRLISGQIGRAHV